MAANPLSRVFPGRSKTSIQSERIVEWLKSCGEPVEDPRYRISRPSPSPDISHSQSKRKRTNMDEETPRAKRRMIGVATPSDSFRGELRRPTVGDDNTPSLRSSITTSRSSSPSKRQREAEIEFSKPAFDFHSRSDSRRWKEKHARQIPLMTQLLESISAHDIETRVTPNVLLKLEKLLQEMEKCKDRGATEEAWSDAVVHPALRLAKKLSHSRDCIDIINVKAIDVWPTELLPVNTQGLPISKKRVDYTIGLEVAEHDQIKAVLHTIEDHTMTQSNHKMLRDRALCSHLEIKTDRSPDDGRFQLSTWCAAGFQKQENLWLQRHRHLREPPTPTLAPIPLWLWKEKNVQLWVAVMDSERMRIHVLDEKVFLIDEDDVRSLLKVVMTIVAVMEWGIEWYVPWLKEYIGWPEEKERGGEQG